MRIAKQTSTKLVVRTNEKHMLFIAGTVILIAGILVVSFVRMQPLRQEDLLTPTLLRYQQEGDPSIEGETDSYSTAVASFRLAHYTGLSFFGRERPWVGLAVIGMIVGGFIVIGPHRGMTVTFNKLQKQVQIKESRWFFRSHHETHPFHDIAEVRVERDRTRERGDKNYGVSLIISYSEGAPLSNNYVHYKTVFSLSESFRYDYQSAQAVVDKIRTFLAAA